MLPCVKTQVDVCAHVLLFQPRPRVTLGAGNRKLVKSITQNGIEYLKARCNYQAKEFPFFFRGRKRVQLRGSVKTMRRPWPKCEVAHAEARHDRPSSMAQEAQFFLLDLLVASSRVPLACAWFGESFLLERECQQFIDHKTSL